MRVLLSLGELASELAPLPTGDDAMLSLGHTADGDNALVLHLQYWQAVHVIAIIDALAVAIEQKAVLRTNPVAPKRVQAVDGGLLRQISNQ